MFAPAGRTAFGSLRLRTARYAPLRVQPADANTLAEYDPICLTRDTRLERTFGYAPRIAHERLRVAQALDGLPDLRARLAEGQLNWSAVRELTRVAVPETEADWIEAADGQTVRDVERMVRGRVPGDRPESDFAKRKSAELNEARVAGTSFRPGPAVRKRRVAVERRSEARSEQEPVRGTRSRWMRTKHGWLRLRRSRAP